MKSSSVLALMTAAVGAATAQQANVSCQVVSGNFCVGPAVAHCHNDVYTDTQMCSDALDSLSPIGIKTEATCYQTNSTSGDAACAYRGTVYPNGGASFPQPGYKNSTGNGTTASTIYSTQLFTITSCTTIVKSSLVPVSSTASPASATASPSAATNLTRPSVSAAGINSTSPTMAPSSATSSTSPTATSTPPFPTGPLSFKGAASTNQVGGGLLGLLGFVALFAL